VGIPIAIAGAFTLLFISRFLPDIKQSNKIENYFLETKVLANSKLIGKTISQNKLRNLEYLFLSEIIREDKVISPVTPNEIIQENDILLFSGDIKQINILKQFDGLKLEHTRHSTKDELLEVIISNESNLINKNIKESNFRSKFNASVVAIKRGKDRLSGKISEIPLQVGDNLILSIGKDFHKRDNIKKNFYLTTPIGIENKLTSNQSLFVGLSFLSVLIASFFKVIPLVKGLFFLLVVFTLLKFLKVEEIKRRFPYELLLIIGSALGIASVMIQSGLAQDLAGILNTLFGGYGVYGAFIAVYLLTFLLTEIITNNAAAALSFPIAYSTAIAFDSSLMPFVMAVAYGASASFLMPFGYQTNLMVYSVGGYDMKTFLKSGIIVSIVYSILVITLIPLIFPF
jgi:di/tricarboxylate transporter